MTGTGKTVTSATIVYHLTRQNQGQVGSATPLSVQYRGLGNRIGFRGFFIIKTVEYTPPPIFRLLVVLKVAMPCPLKLGHVTMNMCVLSVHGSLFVSGVRF